MRLFIAVWPSAEVIGRVADLDRPVVAGVRWTTPLQWHVTLRFCGKVADDAVASLADELAAGLAGESPRLVATGSSTARFGSAGALYLPVTGLEEIAARVRAATAAHGDHQEERPFHGHLTLARARRGLPRDLVGRPVEPMTWTAVEVAIVSSTPGANGARYETMATVRLGS
ncbi:MAG: 2-5 ligase family protein [Acidimicrobiales bacterium]|nr:2-5 ligase family protein [Acidimicrobiales bacterium]